MSSSLSSNIIAPFKFTCPLSQRVMVHPVTTPSGRTFERSAILAWLVDGNGTCPITGEQLTVDDLMPNYRLAMILSFWRQNHKDAVVAVTAAASIVTERHTSTTKTEHSATPLSPSLSLKKTALKKRKARDFLQRVFRAHKNAVATTA